jgi:hypothetical protein
VPRPARRALAPDFEGTDPHQFRPDLADGLEPETAADGEDNQAQNDIVYGGQRGELGLGDQSGQPQHPPGGGPRRQTDDQIAGDPGDPHGGAHSTGADGEQIENTYGEQHRQHKDIR